MSRNLLLLDQTRAGLLVVDIQEKILAVMENPKQVVENAVKLIKGFQILERPIYVTEQYPEGLGSTVDPVKKALGEYEAMEKLTFSCCGIDDFSHTIRSQKIDQLVVCGIEAHVCVWQTAMDLLADRFHVSVVRDATSSRKAEDGKSALAQMESQGVHVTTTEMVLFELLRKAGTDHFKKISKLIK